MLSLKFIRENADMVVERLRVRRFEAKDIVNEILNLYRRRNELQNEADSLKAEMNKISKEIGILFRQGKTDEANAAKAHTGELKDSVKEKESEFAEIDRELEDLQVQLPNMPADIVPPGNSDEDNVIVAKGGNVRKLTESSLPHWELAEKYDLIDFELGVKITGAGFPVYKGDGAGLQRALINFFLEQAREDGYLEVQPPYVVNEASVFGTGHLPDKEGQMYHATVDNLYLIPTAEVPLTNIYRNMIIDEKELPVKNVAYSACFRREAGSYGKDVRGLNRLHQFDKVEIVQIAKPENSYKALDEMVAYVRSIIEKLELPFRILRLCGGDLGFASALTYDFEVWSAAQERWLEVSSVSNFESFQSNRLKLRLREAGQKRPALAHTLNGSALALPRIVAALLENNQTADGIKIPDALVPYLGKDVIN